MDDQQRRWQHATPQRDLDHEVTKGKGQRCATCGKLIIEVDGNEGPESLKSLLRLR